MPRIGRPRGVSPNSFQPNASWAVSDGSSSVIAISSRITERSASTSLGSSTEPVTDRPRELLIQTGKDDTGYLILRVADSGIGISAENANRVFDAFFTTKSSGLGMGLSICRSIVEAHGGRMSASNNDGPGATFQLLLPLHREDI